MRQAKYAKIFPMHLSEQQHEALRRQAELLSAERRRKVTMAEVVRELIDWIEKGQP